MNTDQGSNDDVFGSRADSTTTFNHTEALQSSLSMKYEISNTANKGTDTYHNLEHAHHKQESLLFFNYHEYMVNNYTLIGSDMSDIHEQSIVITHFPNYSVEEDSEISKTTRIVRIPRTFNIKGIVYPEFSTVLPGSEPAAIQETITGTSESEDVAISKFVPKGIYEGQIFGTTSVSPLNCYFNDDEFSQLMKSINSRIRNCYTSYHFWNILEFFLDMLTFWLLSDLFKFQSKKVS